MKEVFHRYIDDNSQETIALGDLLYDNGELGFKEFETKRIIEEYCASHNLKITQHYYTTGLAVSIGQGKPHIGLIAEMDGIVTIGHPHANTKENAAHSCGHSTQVTIMLAAMDTLNQLYKDIKGTVTLFFTPAEEFTDLDYRKKLIEDGVIKYASGKQNMIADHLIDDVDLFIHFHSTVLDGRQRFSIDGTLAGFVYKKYIFKGVGSHAAVAADKGVNALNMATLFISAANMLRETFKEEDMVRVHGIIVNGGQSVNSIPEEVVYECYVRSVNPDTLLQLSDRLDNTAIHCAKAIGGNCIIEQSPGYLPLVPSYPLGKVIYNNMLQFAEADQIKHYERSIAAGDVGDISVFKPIIQYGYTGFNGLFHGKSFEITDKQQAYITQVKVVCDSAYDLLQQPETVEEIVKQFSPTMTYSQYIEHLNKK